MTSEAYDRDRPIDLVPNQDNCPILHRMARAHDAKVESDAERKAAANETCKAYEPDTYPFELDGAPRIATVVGPTFKEKPIVTIDEPTLTTNLQAARTEISALRKDQSKAQLQINTLQTLLAGNEQAEKRLARLERLAAATVRRCELLSELCETPTIAGVKKTGSKNPSVKVG